MTCAACQHHVESALRSTAGVESAHVDLMANRATVVFDPLRADPPASCRSDSRRRLRRSSCRAGRSSQSSGDSEHSGDKQDLKAWLTIAAGVVAMLVAMPLDAHMGLFDRALMRQLPWLYAIPPDLVRWTLLIATAVLLVWAGRPIFANAARGLRHGTTNMNSLVSLGTGVAFLYSAFATIAPGNGKQVYFDAVLLILGFLLLGQDA